MCKGTTCKGKRGSVIGGNVGLSMYSDGKFKRMTIEGHLVIDPPSYVKRNHVTIQGGITKADLTSAVNAALAASKKLAALKPNKTLSAVTRSFTVTGTGGRNVVNIASLNIVKGLINIQGGPSDIFVFNVAGKFELDNTHVHLMGGIRSCQVLWNFTGTKIKESNEVELEKGADAVGIFLVPQRLVEFRDSARITGRVFAGGEITLESVTIRPQ